MVGEKVAILARKDRHICAVTATGHHANVGTMTHYHGNIGSMTGHHDNIGTMTGHHKDKGKGNDTKFFVILIDSQIIYRKFVK